MLDDFFTRAILAGIGMAAVTGPLGCFVVWRRLSYFGDTLSHAALLGVALGMLLDVNIMLAVFTLAVLVALAMLALQRRVPLSPDTILGVLSHGGLALGLIVISFMTWLRMDLMGLLFGDLLAVTRTDIAIIFAGGAGVLAVLALVWKPLFATTVNREMAEAEGIPAARMDVILMLLLAAVVAVSIKIVGAMLITAMLIIPASVARRLSAGPIAMAGMASLAGVASVLMGLWASRTLDTPSGPSVVAASLVLFAVALLLPQRSLVSRSAP